jgi:hypothetical protein
LVRTSGECCACKRARPQSGWSWSRSCCRDIVLVDVVVGVIRVVNIIVIIVTRYGSGSYWWRYRDGGFNVSD